MTRVHVAKIPDQNENRRRFAMLEMADRRAIIRAVNRGEVMEERKLAIIAVGVARRQQRFWKRAWLLGPAVGILQPLFPDVTLAAAAINTAVTTALLVLLSWHWHRRALQAEARNLERVGASRIDPGPRAGGGRARRRRHLPGHGRGDADAGPHTNVRAADGHAIEATGPTPPTHRPHRPRGRKRR